MLKYLRVENRVVIFVEVTISSWCISSIEQDGMSSKLWIQLDIFFVLFVADFVIQGHIIYNSTHRLIIVINALPIKFKIVWNSNQSMGLLSTISF